jgi:hypothetical protein
VPHSKVSKNPEVLGTPIGSFPSFREEVGESQVAYAEGEILSKNSPPVLSFEAPPHKKGYALCPRGRQKEVSPSKEGVSLDLPQSNTVG